MSVSIPIFDSARRTAPGPRVQKRKAHPSIARSIKYAAVVAAGVALFGLLAPPNATAQRSELCSLGDVSPSTPAADSNSEVRVSGFGQESDRDLTSRLPWLAPVGHRQPRLVDVPPDISVTPRERAQARLNAQLDQKLIICRC
jgi:hypothetical protein